MRIITYDGGDWLVGDEMASVLIEYSVIMARQGSADSVDVAGLTLEGAPQQVSVVLGPATMMSTRSIEVDFAEPDNSATVATVRGYIDAIESPQPVLPTPADESIGEYDL